MIAPRLAHTSDIERARALRMQEICEELGKLIAGGKPVRKAAAVVVARHAGGVVQSGDQVRVISFTAGSLVNQYYRWDAAGRTPDAFVAASRYGRRREMPDDLVIELKRRCQLPGAVNNTPVINDLKAEWRRGLVVPGLGDWQSWWRNEWPDLPLPEHAPEFPFSDRTLHRYCPKRGSAARVRATQGKAAAAKLLPHVTLNYSNLKPGEMYVYDDVRLDVLCIDDATGLPTECKAYISYEVGSRLIPAFVFRPANAFVKTDIDELVVQSLQVVGLNPDGSTKLMFERGTLTMSPRAGDVLKKVSGGQIVVIHNGMDAEVLFAGANADAGKGHWMGKGVIESLMRKIHLSLQQHTGQRGSSYAQQPDMLGWGGEAKRPKRGTLADEASMLAQIQLAFGSRVKLNLGMLWVSEMRQILHGAVRMHNEQRGCKYQGHGFITQLETAPGIWEDSHEI